MPSIYGGGKLGFNNYYYFCCDSQKILALGLSVSIFLLFKNMTIRYNKHINTLAASAFGVLLIHSNSWTMRHFLWNDLLDVPNFYVSNWLFLHFVLSVVLIYLVCSFVDFLRVKLIEIPFFAMLKNNSFLYKECFVGQVNFDMPFKKDFLEIWKQNILLLKIVKL